MEVLHVDIHMNNHPIDLFIKQKAGTGTANEEEYHHSQIDLSAYPLSNPVVLLSHK